jgi:hypothetical protein
MTTVAAMPAHAYPLTNCPARYPHANLINYPGNFMARHARVLDARPNTFLR